MRLSKLKHAPAVIKPLLMAVPLLAVAALISPLITQANAAGVNESIISKKLTKAECLKKPGYIWIASSGRCVKDTRGSH